MAASMLVMAAAVVVVVTDAATYGTGVDCNRTVKSGTDPQTYRFMAHSVTATGKRASR